MATARPEIAILSEVAVIGAKQREKNHKVLQPILTDLVAYARVLKQLHWNVTGRHFRPIHQHLDEIYEFVDAGIDDVAERLAAGGCGPQSQRQAGRCCPELRDRRRARRLSERRRGAAARRPPDQDVHRASPQPHGGD